MKIRFGAAGNPDSFYAAGYRSSLQMPAYLASLGLNAYEYQLSRGVRISEKMARQLGEEAVKHDVLLSVHAPYYINFASPDPQIQASSREHLLKSVEAARWLGAQRVVFHPGGAARMERETAVQLVRERLQEVIAILEDRGWTDVYLCPETMGKKNQVGTLAEVIEFCQFSPMLLPCVDFGHLNALLQGELETEAGMNRVLEDLAAGLGPDVLSKLHVHFSPVEYTTGGEKRHATVADGIPPDFRWLVPGLKAWKATPVIICESAGTQAEDACHYRDLYLEG